MTGDLNIMQELAELEQRRFEVKIFQVEFPSKNLCSGDDQPDQVGEADPCIWGHLPGGHPPIWEHQQWLRGVPRVEWRGWADEEKEEVQGERSDFQQIFSHEQGSCWAGRPRSERGWFRLGGEGRIGDQGGDQGKEEDKAKSLSVSLIPKLIFFNFKDTSRLTKKYHIKKNSTSDLYKSHVLSWVRSVHCTDWKLPLNNIGLTATSNIQGVFSLVPP